MRNTIKLILTLLIIPGTLFGSQNAFNLNDAIQAALNSTYAKNAELMKEIADLDRIIYQSIYAPSVSVEGSLASDKSAKGNSFMPNTEVAGTSATYSQSLKSGTQFSANASVYSQSLDYSDFPDQSYTDSSISVTLEQDIWRNAFGFQDQLSLYSQDIQKTVRYLETADALEETIYQATLGFWAVVLADKSQITNKQAMDNAKKVYELNVEKEKSGLSEPRTVQAFKANWLQKKQRYDQAVYQYDKAMDNFMTLLDLEKEPKLNESVDTYLKLLNSAKLAYNWTEQSQKLRRYQIAQLKEKGHEIAIAQALDNIKPKVVLFGSAGFNGVEDELFDSISAVPSFQNLSAEVGVKMNFSSRKYSQYELQREKLKQTLQDNNTKLLEDDLQLLLKEASRYVSWLKANVETSKQIEATLKTKYQEDKKQFEVGRINVDELIQSDDGYRQAQLETLKATYDYLQTIGYYFRVENTLLDKIGVLAKHMNQKES